MLTPISYRDEAVELIDQTRLPQELVTLTITDYRELADAIRTMKIRGAPVIARAVTQKFGSCQWESLTGQS